MPVGRRAGAGRRRRCVVPSAAAGRVRRDRELRGHDPAVPSGRDHHAAAPTRTARPDPSRTNYRSGQGHSVPERNRWHPVRERPARTNSHRPHGNPVPEQSHWHHANPGRERIRSHHANPDRERNRSHDGSRDPGRNRSHHECPDPERNRSHHECPGPGRNHWHHANPAPTHNHSGPATRGTAAPRSSDHRVRGDACARRRPARALRGQGPNRTDLRPNHLARQAIQRVRGGPGDRPASAGRCSDR